MDAEQLRNRILAGEDSATEFKSASAASLLDGDDVSKALVALANSGGGELILGVEDGGAVTGVGSREDSDAIQRKVMQLASSITPPLPVQTQAVAFEAKIVVVVRVPRFLPERPFRGKSKYFVRHGPSSREARPEELKRLLTSSPIHYFDEQTVDRAERMQLDDGAISEFLRTAYPSARSEETERYLAALFALDQEARPTVTGIVLFGREPTAFLPGAYSSAVRFPGIHATGKFQDSSEIRGNAFQQVDGAVAFLVKHLSTPSKVHGLTRITTAIPVEVWREAITNAITHRDYSSANQVRVFVYDDRVEIINPGELLNRLTIENIRLAGTKQPRNPHIASAIARRGLRENLGIGVPEILRLVAERGLPEPEIDVATGEFRITIFTRA